MFQPSHYSGWLPGWVPFVATWDEKKEANIYGTCNGCITGDENDEAKGMVQALQYKLASIGYLSRRQATGLYDAKTVSAVEKLQRDEGLGVDGMVGDDTMDAIEAVQEPGEISATMEESTAVTTQEEEESSGVPSDLPDTLTEEIKLWEREWFFPALLVGTLGIGLFVVLRRK
jgi:peptidoglycan hydrolase-like protein with peptidoglycan-binding domain